MGGAFTRDCKVALNPGRTTDESVVKVTNIELPVDCTASGSRGPLCCSNSNPFEDDPSYTCVVKID